MSSGLSITKHLQRIANLPITIPCDIKNQNEPTGRAAKNPAGPPNTAPIRFMAGTQCWQHCKTPNAP